MTEFDIEEIKKDAGGELPGPKVTEKDINFVIDIIQKEAKHDKPSIKQLFFGMATAFTRLGMGHKVNSRDSGAGKSYLTNKVAGYYPDQHVKILGGASNKAFQHKQGELVIKDEDTGKYKPVEPLIEELEEQAQDLDPQKQGKEIKTIEKEIKSLRKKSHKLIDLDNTIIVIQDTPQEGLLSNLMSSERGGKNIFDIYRLEDHEGKEITISELVESCLSNPEICFKECWPEMEASDVRFTRNPANHNQSYATQIIINHLHNV